MLARKHDGRGRLESQSLVVSNSLIGTFAEKETLYFERVRIRGNRIISVQLFLLFAYVVLHPESDSFSLALLFRSIYCRLLAKQILLTCLRIASFPGLLLFATSHKNLTEPAEANRSFQNIAEF